jgi:hypothetical protein
MELTEVEVNEMDAETKIRIRKMFHTKCRLAKAELTYLCHSFKLKKGSTNYARGGQITQSASQILPTDQMH